MTVYIFQAGTVVPKSERDLQPPVARSTFPSPMLSRLEPYESPVTGREISTWRDRDRDMKAADAFDPRDLPKDHQFTKGRAARAMDNGRHDTNLWR